LTFLTFFLGAEWSPLAFLALLGGGAAITGSGAGVGVGVASATAVTG